MEDPDCSCKLTSVRRGPQALFMGPEFDDGTGVIRVAQPNTYDTAMYGPNTFIGR